MGANIYLKKIYIKFCDFVFNFKFNDKMNLGLYCNMLDHCTPQSKVKKNFPIQFKLIIQY